MFANFSLLLKVGFKTEVCCNTTTGEATLLDGTAIYSDCLILPFDGRGPAAVTLFSDDLVTKLDVCEVGFGDLMLGEIGPLFPDLTARELFFVSISFSVFLFARLRATSL